MKSAKVNKRGTAVLLLIPLAAQAFAQCENKSGFARKVCEAAAARSVILPGPASARPAAVKNQSLTTSFADTIHLDTLSPDYDPKAFRALTRLERADDGSFLLKTGIYEAYVESYSLDSGDAGTTRIGGYFPAPLKGTRARVIGEALKQVELHPEVAHSDIQQLFWALVGGVDLEKMQPQVQQTAARILSREALVQIRASVIAGNANTSLMQRINQRLGGNAPSASDSAANRNDGAISQPSQGDSSGIAADPSGSPFGSDDGPVLQGTWALLPGGFYVRYLPETTARIKVQVIVPEKAIAQAAPRNPLTFDPTQFLAVYSQSPVQRLGITLRPVNIAR